MVLVDFSSNIPIRATFRSWGTTTPEPWTGIGGKIKRLGRKKQEDSTKNFKDVAKTDNEKPNPDYPTPQTIKGLEALCWTTNEQCTCDICAPDAYCQDLCTSKVTWAQVYNLDRSLPLLGSD
jgi:hypothetical protein